MLISACPQPAICQTKGTDDEIFDLLHIINFHWTIAQFTVCTLQLISRNSVVQTVHFWESIDRDVCLFQNVHVLGLFDFTGSFAELGFLKLLLEDAPVLRIVGIIDKGLDRDVLKNLLKMRRASRDAEILIL